MMFFFFLFYLLCVCQMYIQDVNTHLHPLKVKLIQTLAGVMDVLLALLYSSWICGRWVKPCFTLTSSSSSLNDGKKKLLKQSGTVKGN